MRVKAGRIFLRKIQEITAKGESFAIETTLAGKSMVQLIKQLRQKNYRVEIIFIFVENIEEAINRIKVRVKKGGHAVPVEDIKRRFSRSKNNFWNIYQKLSDAWKIVLNSKDEFILVTIGSRDQYEIINEGGFLLFQEGLNYGKKRL